MIDLHCHILPGVDDGAQNLDEALLMAEKAVADGITHILCTPHHNNGTYNNNKNDVIKAVASLQKELDDREIPLTLFEGQEVHVTGILLEEIATNNILFVDMDDQYLLLEFPTMDVPAYSEELFYQLKMKGITPIIVHPERNTVFMNEPNKLKDFIEAGALAQVTAISYTGVFGKKIQKAAYTMIEHDLVHIVASDAHNVAKRSFSLQEAYELMEKEFGKEKVAAFQQRTKDLINGDPITIPEPKKVEKKGLNFFKLS